jgi:hypothetical protein
MYHFPIKDLFTTGGSTKLITKHLPNWLESLALDDLAAQVLTRLESEVKRLKSEVKLRLESIQSSAHCFMLTMLASEFGMGVIVMASASMYTIPLCIVNVILVVLNHSVLSI